jgi:hypothetical protein
MRSSITEEKNYEKRILSTVMLSKKNVDYTSHNEGRHLVVKGDIDEVDFWPGTGKWVGRDKKKTSGYGVDTLLKFLGVK